MIHMHYMMEEVDFMIHIFSDQLPTLFADWLTKCQIPFGGFLLFLSQSVNLIIFLTVFSELFFFLLLLFHYFPHSFPECTLLKILFATYVYVDMSHFT